MLENINPKLGDGPLRLIRLPMVISITGLPRSTLYQMIRAEEFPKSVMIGKRSVAWVESEVTEWIARNIKNRS